MVLDLISLAYSLLKVGSRSSIPPLRHIPSIYSQPRHMEEAGLIFNIVSPPFLSLLSWLLSSFLGSVSVLPLLISTVSSTLPSLEQVLWAFPGPGFHLFLCPSSPSYSVSVLLNLMLSLLEILHLNRQCLETVPKMSVMGIEGRPFVILQTMTFIHSLICSVC